MTVRVLIAVISVLFAGCSYPDDHLEGVVVVLDTDASSITEVVKPIYPRIGVPLAGAKVRVLGSGGTVSAITGADGSFRLDIRGGPPAEKGRLLEVQVEATGCQTAATSYLAFPGRDAQYVLVILKEAA